MVKKLTIILSVCLWVIAIQAQNFGSEAMRKLQIAEFAISNFYMDKVGEDKLVEEAIIRTSAQLDPHPTYSDAERVKEMNEPLQGNFEGIRVQSQMIEDTLLVVQPVSSGPPERAGILTGDRIVVVNDSAIAGVKMGTEDVMKRLRGPKGSRANLTIVRHGVQNPLSFTVKRDKIPILSLDASYVIQPRTGYIRINRFGVTIAEEFRRAMTSLQKQGMKDMTLDLQGSGGGYLNVAVDLTNEFLRQKGLIVCTEGRTAKHSDFYAKGNGDFRDGRLIMLAGEYTASASEIVSGAVRDWNRGIIVGRRSFGKGLVQRPTDLSGGSMIRLTIARYYTPSRRSIQKPYDNTVDYGKDLIERFNHGELMDIDSIHFPNSLKIQTRKLGRIVYDGGGIMPGYFMPIDTILYTGYHRNLVAKGAVIKFTIQFIKGRREELANKYKKFEPFDEKFVVNDDMLAILKKIGEEEGVKFNEEQYQGLLPLIKTQLKALIAHDLWDMNEYFRIVSTTNESIQGALEILDSDEYQKKLK